MSVNPLETPQAEVGELLAAIGNHEGKAILSLAMETNRSYRRLELWDAVTKYTLDNTVIAETGPAAWCQQSLEPAGLVRRTNQHPLCLELTQEGHQRGQAVAGLLLPIGEQFDISLTSLWGLRESHGKIRSPLSRLLIGSCLLESEAPKTMHQIADQTGLDARLVSAQAETMHRDKLLLHYAWDHGAQDVRFSIADKAYVPSPIANPATKQAIEYLHTYGEATLSELEAVCFANLSPEEQAITNRAKFRDTLNISLAAQVHKMRLQRVGRSDQQDVALSATQRELWSNVLAQLHKFAHHSQAVRDGFAQQGKDFIQDPTRVQQALIRAQQTQSATHGRETLQTMVQQIITDADRPLSVRDITAVISEKRSRITTAGVRNILRELVDSGSVMRQSCKTNTNLFSAPTDHASK